MTKHNRLMQNISLFHKMSLYGERSTFLNKLAQAPAVAPVAKPAHPTTIPADVQQALFNMGFAGPGFKADGQWGPATDAAIAKFKATLKLAPGLTNEQLFNSIRAQSMASSQAQANNAPRPSPVGVAKAHKTFSDLMKKVAIEPSGQPSTAPSASVPVNKLPSTLKQMLNGVSQSLSANAPQNPNVAKLADLAAQTEGNVDLDALVQILAAAQKVLESKGQGKGAQAGEAIAAVQSFKQSANAGLNTEPLSPEAPQTAQKGATGRTIPKDVQQALQDMGFTAPGFTVDGLWGKYTDAALDAFKVAHKLNPDLTGEQLFNAVRAQKMGQGVAGSAKQAPSPFAGR